MTPLSAAFFDRDSRRVAVDLLGKVLRRRTADGLWLAAAIVETEAYQEREKGSHASLGRTPSREALWAPPGTIYMYFSRAGDSLNASCGGDGDAVLIKAGRPFTDARSPAAALSRMHTNNPARDGSKRPDHRLCGGQTLLCKALELRVREWTGRPWDPDEFFIDDVGVAPSQVVRTRRLGIPAGRDEQLLWRFVDADHPRCATENPLTKRTWRRGRDFELLAPGDLEAVGARP